MGQEVDSWEEEEEEGRGRREKVEMRRGRGKKRRGQTAAVATTAGRAVAAVARRGAVPEEGEALAAALRDGPGDGGPRQRDGRRTATEATLAAAATRVSPRESKWEEDAGRRPAPSRCPRGARGGHRCCARRFGSASAASASAEGITWIAKARPPGRRQAR